MSTPSDHTTLSAVLDGYAERGYDAQLEVLDDGLRCVTCGSTSPAERFEIQSLRRLEGASDPADMAAVLATACPACGTLGAVVVMFGPEASAAEAHLLRRAHDRRFEDEDVPPAAAPGESAVDERPGRAEPTPR